VGLWLAYSQSVRTLLWLPYCHGVVASFLAGVSLAVAKLRVMHAPMHTACCAGGALVGVPGGGDVSLQATPWIAASDGVLLGGGGGSVGLWSACHLQHSAFVCTQLH
jgi:hypothetical protein